MDDAHLEALTDEAFRRLDAVDGDPSRLEEPYRTIAIITSAQGVIDNGGLAYFFGSNWPHQPPYSDFADAYERIGCREGAAAIRAAAESFRIADPERHRERRQAYIAAHTDPAGFGVTGWDDGLCGDERVWQNLAAWARAHPAPGH